MFLKKLFLLCVFANCCRRSMCEQPSLLGRVDSKKLQKSKSLDTETDPSFIPTPSNLPTDETTSDTHVSRWKTGNRKKLMWVDWFQSYQKSDALVSVSGTGLYKKKKQKSPLQPNLIERSRFKVRRFSLPLSLFLFTSCCLFEPNILVSFFWVSFDK